MITLILAKAGVTASFNEILGYVLTTIELCFVVLKLISLFVPPNSKVGKIISKILKGLYSSKQYLNNNKDEILKNLNNYEELIENDKRGNVTKSNGNERQPHDDNGGT